MSAPEGAGRVTEPRRATKAKSKRTTTKTGKATGDPSEGEVVLGSAQLVVDGDDAADEDDDETNL